MKNLILPPAIMIEPELGKVTVQYYQQSMKNQTLAITAQVTFAREEAESMNVIGLLQEADKRRKKQQPKPIPSKKR